MPYKDPEQKRIHQREYQKSIRGKLLHQIWVLNNPEKIKNYKAIDYQKHKEKYDKKHLIYINQHLDIKHKVERNQKAKRRVLGHIELNQFFNGSQAHHIDKEHIIYIPTELHNSIRHNVWNGKHMNEINAKVLDWLNIIPL
jgi:hypothetical protein